MPITALVQAVLLLVGLGLGALFPRNRGVSFWADDVVNLVTGALLFPIRYGLTLAGVAVAQAGAPGLVGHVHLELVPWAQFVVCFLTLDFTKYWLHRADHRVPWLWTFHRVHHSTEHLDATAGLRMHVVDFLQLTAVPVVLFGVILDVSGFESWVLPAAISMGIVADTFSHMNVRFPYQNPLVRALLYVFNNPLFHAWHHTRDGVLCDGNYANCLPIWDVIFGSNVTRPEPPELYGIDGDQRLENDVLGLQLLRPRKP